MEQEIKQLYWKIGAVASMINCAESKVRFWCEEFNITLRRTKNGSRMFAKEDVDLILKINALVNKGYTLKGIKMLFSGKVAAEENARIKELTEKNNELLKELESAKDHSSVQDYEIQRLNNKIDELKDRWFTVWDKTNRRESRGRHYIDSAGLVYTDLDPHGTNMDGVRKIACKPQFELITHPQSEVAHFRELYNAASEFKNAPRQEHLAVRMNEHETEAIRKMFSVITKIENLYESWKSLKS